jgi:hypothetical protein
VVNAGGLNPVGLADAVRELASELGVELSVAAVTGDDLLPRLDELRGRGHDLSHLDTGASLGDLPVPPLTANAYLGGWGIAAALERGADVVVTGRVTDASLVVGPAAWRFGWARDDWDRLAGAVVAGHAIECGAHVTGGNYSFFAEVPGLEHVGSRSRRSTRTAAAPSPSTRGRAGWSTSGRSRRSCSTRSADRATSAPTS